MATPKNEATARHLIKLDDGFGLNMKNKDKYKLTDLKIKLTELPKRKFDIPKKHWKIQVIKDNSVVETINLKGGTMTDLMAWLESND